MSYLAIEEYGGCERFDSSLARVERHLSLATSLLHGKTQPSPKLGNTRSFANSHSWVLCRGLKRYDNGKPQIDVIEGLNC